MKHVELTGRAEKNLKRLDTPVRTRIVDVLPNELSAEPEPDNLNVKALVGAAPWLRLRDGDYRVLYRPLDAAELAVKVQHLPRAERPKQGYLVDRIVHRKDLDRAVDTL